MIEIDMTLRGYAVDPKTVAAFFPRVSFEIMRKGNRLNNRSKAEYRHNAILASSKVANDIPVSLGISSLVERCGGWDHLGQAVTKFEIAFIEFDVIIRLPANEDPIINGHITAELVKNLAKISASVGYSIEMT